MRQSKVSVTHGSIGTTIASLIDSVPAAFLQVTRVWDLRYLDVFSPRTRLMRTIHYRFQKFAGASDFLMEIDINPDAKFQDGKPITAHDVALHLW